MRARRGRRPMRACRRSRCGRTTRPCSMPGRSCRACNACCPVTKLGRSTFFGAVPRTRPLVRRRRSARSAGDDAGELLALRRARRTRRDGRLPPTMRRRGSQAWRDRRCQRAAARSISISRAVAAARASTRRHARRRQRSERALVERHEVGVGHHHRRRRRAARAVRRRPPARATSGCSGRSRSCRCSP